MTEPRHGDARMRAAGRPAILQRRIEQLRSEADPGRPGWILIENEGAIFRGPNRGNPVEVWSPARGWLSYADADRERGVEWGTEIDAAEALAVMRERAGVS